MKTGYTYILECANGSFYTGSTTDITRRFRQHQMGEGARHTAKNLPVKLVYLEKHSRIDIAFNREKQIQRWRRDKKLALINCSENQLSRLAKAYCIHGKSVLEL